MRNLYFVLALLLLSSCYDPDILQEVSTVNISDASLLFKVETKSIYGQSESADDGYWKMTGSGALEPVKVLDEQGKAVMVRIENIWKIGDRLLGITVRGNSYSYSNFIVERRTGKIITHSYPDNAASPGYDTYDGDVMLWAVEHNDKLYLPGGYGSSYVEVDLKKQTSIACIPSELIACNLVISKDNLMAFNSSSGDRPYPLVIMTPDKKLEKYKGENRAFVDNEGRLYRVEFKQDKSLENVTEMSFYRVELRGDGVKEDLVCVYHKENPSLSLGDGYLFTINSENNKVIMMAREDARVLEWYPEWEYEREVLLDGYGLYEFDGRTMKRVSFFERDFLQPYLLYYLDFERQDKFVPSFCFRMPEDNLFWNDRSSISSLGHVDLSTYEFVEREVELFDESEYSLIGLVVKDARLFYSCRRLSDNQVVTFVMDYKGNKNVISEFPEGTAVGSFLRLN